MKICRYISGPLWLLACVGVLVCLTPSISLCQDSEKERKLEKARQMLDELKQSLSEHQLALAEEYVEILDDLQDVIDDYEEYFDELPRDERRDHQQLFNEFRDRLHDSDYLDNPKKLKADIDSFIEEIRVVEREHGRDDKELACCKVLKSLRRELSIIGQHVDEYLSAKTEKQLKLQQMNEYLAALLSQLSDVRRVEVEAPQIVERTHVGIGHVPKPESPPAVPSLPGQNRVPESWIAYELVDSIPAVKGISRLSIVNPSSNIRVVGWQRPMITAVLTIEAPDEADIRRVIEETTTLKIGRGASEYDVVVKLPTIARREFNLPELVLKVPPTLEVRAENQFGQITVSQMKANLVLTGSQSEINVDEVSAPVQVRNNQGETRLFRVEGPITASNSHGELLLSECNGAILVQNEYGTVQVQDCRGSIKVNGTGSASIDGFSGSIVVENSYGPVDIRNVRGNVQAKNAYEILKIRSVSGFAELANSYSNITVYKVGGALSASTNDGKIFAEELGSTVKLDSENGDIRLVVDDHPRGLTRLYSSNGQVAVELIRPEGFLINAQTVGGQIISTIPADLSSLGDRKSGVFKFGIGRDSVIVSGHRSNILIVKEN